MRKSLDVTVAAKGRDYDKRFRITEMPAYQAEAWGMRAMSAMARAGVEIPQGIIPEMLGGNMLAILAVGIPSLLKADFADVQPLLAEMMECVQALNVTDGGETTVRRLIPDDTEEWTTLPWLRDKVLELHLGFSLAATLSTLRQAAVAARNSPQPRTKTSRKSRGSS